MGKGRRSMRRSRENQRQSERLERAMPIWARLADFPYGPAARGRPHNEAGHTKAPDTAPTQMKDPLHPTGRPHMIDSYTC